MYPCKRNVWIRNYFEKFANPYLIEVLEYGIKILRGDALY